MARQLAPRGFQSDVFDLGRLDRNVERLDLLPEPVRRQSLSRTT
jgi:hypothetical protein